MANKLCQPQAYSKQEVNLKLVQSNIISSTPNQNQDFSNLFEEEAAAKFHAKSSQPREFSSLTESSTVKTAREVNYSSQPQEISRQLENLNTNQYDKITNKSWKSCKLNLVEVRVIELKKSFCPKLVLLSNFQFR